MERRKQLGVESPSGCSREEIAAAFTDVWLPVGCLFSRTLEGCLRFVGAWTLPVASSLWRSRPTFSCCPRRLGVGQLAGSCSCLFLPRAPGQLIRLLSALPRPQVLQVMEDRVPADRLALRTLAQEMRDWPRLRVCSWGLKALSVLNGRWGLFNISSWPALGACCIFPHQLDRRCHA